MEGSYNVGNKSGWENTLKGQPMSKSLNEVRKQAPGPYVGRDFPAKRAARAEAGVELDMSV